MNQFVQLLVAGVSLGAVYALLALGFVVVFKATAVVNFAHPALLAVGAYTTGRLTTTYHVGFWLALALGIGGSVVVAFAVQRFLVQGMAARSVTAISIMTLGVDLVVRTEVTREMGTLDILAVDDPWGNHVVRLAGIVLPVTRLVALVAGVVLIGAFFLWFKVSMWGIAMRAVSSDPETAALMGIRRSRVTALAWSLAGALAAVAGLFLIVFPTPGFSSTTFLAALVAFPAAILGGLDSTGGAVVGGLVVGLSVTLAQGYASQLSFLGANFYEVMPYAVMVLVLLVRPAGLFGTKELHRV
jgi:branched-chain amino acid transport system permease protein